MARRNTATAPAPESTKEDPVSTTTEAPADAAAENTEKAEVEVDLTAFLAAVDSAVTDTEARDATTGELVPNLIDPVNAEFRKLEGTKAKNKARKALNELMKEAMGDPATMPTARSYMILADKLSAGPSGGGSKEKAERAPVDPTDAYVQRIVSLQIASQLVRENIPEGVKDDWADKANALYGETLPVAGKLFEWTASTAEDKGEEPEAGAVARSAVKLANGRAVRTGSGRASGGAGDGIRRDVGKHIAEAFAGVESGKFLSVAQIKAHPSEEYKGVEVSAGAISARLFPASGKPTSVPGIEATTENGKKGARKL